LIFIVSPGNRQNIQTSTYIAGGTPGISSDQNIIRDFRVGSSDLGYVVTT